jgi:hypothetical protein
MQQLERLAAPLQPRSSQTPDVNSLAGLLNSTTSLPPRTAIKHQFIHEAARGWLDDVGDDEDPVTTVTAAAHPQLRQEPHTQADLSQPMYTLSVSDGNGLTQLTLQLPRVCDPGEVVVDVGTGTTNALVRVEVPGKYAPLCVELPPGSVAGCRVDVEPQARWKGKSKRLVLTWQPPV